MKVRLNSAMTAIRGSLAGDQQTYRTYRGKQFLQRKPTFTKPWADGTVAVRKSFGAADQWWKDVVKPDAELSRRYREKGKARMLNYRQMAIRDFLNPPAIHSLGPSDFQPVQGGELRIDAHDDFEVVRVCVVVRDAEGGTVVEGDATLAGGIWRFTVPPPATGAKLSAAVDIIAYDLPGNAGKRTFPLPGAEGPAATPASPDA